MPPRAMINCLNGMLCLFFIGVPFMLVCFVWLERVSGYSWFHWILHDDSWSFALGLNWVKFGVSAVNVHDVPPKLSLAYMITVHPDGILTDDAQLSGTPLAASCEVV